MRGANVGGSSGWQAPEQLIARSGGDARQGYATDIFSYGMLLFYCLTAGKHPFGEHYERDFNILQVGQECLVLSDWLCVHCLDCTLLNELRHVTRGHQD